MVGEANLLWFWQPFEPIGKSFRDILLPESFASDARWISLHRDRPAPQVRQHHRGDGFVVRRHVALADPVIWKEHLFRVRDHDGSRTTSRGLLSARMPRSLGCR